jgi:hypothetical protein
MFVVPDFTYDNSDDENEYKERYAFHSDGDDHANNYDDDGDDDDDDDGDETTGHDHHDEQKQTSENKKSDNDEDDEEDIEFIMPPPSLPEHLHDKRKGSVRSKEKCIHVPHLPLLSLFRLLDVTPSAVKSRLDNVYRECRVCHDTTVTDDVALSLDDRMIMCDIDPRALHDGKNKMHMYLEFMGQELRPIRRQRENAKNWQIKNAKKLKNRPRLKEQQVKVRSLRKNICTTLGIQPIHTNKRQNKPASSDPHTAAPAHTDTAASTATTTTTTTTSTTRTQRTKTTRTHKTTQPIHVPVDHHIEEEYGGEEDTLH